MRYVTEGVTLAITIALILHFLRYNTYNTQPALPAEFLQLIVSKPARLETIKLPIPPPLNPDELSMRPILNDRTFRNDEDPIRLARSAESVCREDFRA